MIYKTIDPEAVWATIDRGTLELKYKNKPNHTILKRYQLITLFVICFLIGSAGDIKAQQQADLTRNPLVDVPYKILPLGSVQPEGWLEEQLQRMANGLTGSLGEIYPNVGESNAWRGGHGDAESSAKLL